MADDLTVADIMRGHVDPDLGRKLGLPEGLGDAVTAADVDSLLGAQGDPPPSIPDPIEVSSAWVVNAARVIARAREFVDYRTRDLVTKPRGKALRALMGAIEAMDKDLDMARDFIARGDSGGP